MRSAPTPEITESLGSRVATEVRAEMARQGRKRADFARELGVSVVTASRILWGRRALDLHELETVAQWLGFTSADLIARAEVQA